MVKDIKLFTVPPLTVICSATSIVVLTDPTFYKTRKIGLAELHLADPKCTGTRIPSGEWSFLIFGNLTECSTKLKVSDDMYVKLYDVM